ncbi:hypothetical protein ACOMHN_015119 [Nucella lapillus]
MHTLKTPVLNRRRMHKLRTPAAGKRRMQEDGEVDRAHGDIPLWLIGPETGRKVAGSVRINWPKIEREGGRKMEYGEEG